MIDSIYNVVQIILNKNDRGVITPDRFNEIANAAQLKIYSEIPNDIRLAINRKNRGNNDNTLSYLRNEIDKFNSTVEIIRDSEPPYYFSFPSDFIEVDSVYSNGRMIEMVDNGKALMYIHSPLVAPSEAYPICVISSGKMNVYPESIKSIILNYKRRLKTPKWTYIPVAGKAMFNISDSTYQDFELGEYFFNRIVTEMLTYLGLHLKEQEVIQISQQEQNTDFNKENMA